MTVLPLKFITGADRVREHNPAARCVLALDMATQLGAAIQHVDGRIAHHSLKFAKGDHAGERYAKFRQWLTRTHKSSGGFDEIFYEKIDFIGTSVENARTKFCFEGNLVSWAHIYGIEPIGISVGTIKKYITSNGHAKKPEVVAAVQALGFNPKDDNEADAIALLLLGLERMAGEAK